MLKNINNFIRIWLKRVIFALFSITLLLFFVKQSFAEDLISTSDAISQIEKVLSSPKGSMITKKKSTFQIDRATKEDEEGQKSKKGKKKSSKIEVKVTKKKENSANRLKEKMAYNAVISSQYEAAAEFYKQILATEPENNYAKFGLGLSYHKLKQYKQAKQIYYDLLTSDIENKDEVISNFLEILIEESPMDARYVLSKLSTENPNTDYILARSALGYNKIGQNDEAIILLKRAVALNPSNMEYQFNLAVILDTNNESSEALSYYKTVLNNYIQSGDSEQKIDLDAVRKRIATIEENLNR